MPDDFDNLDRYDPDLVTLSGVLEVLSEGWGYLNKNSSDPGHRDIYVSPKHIQRFGLKTGGIVIGQVRPPKETEKYSVLMHISSISR